MTRRAKTLRFLARNRFAIQVTLDSLAWAIALAFGTIVRYDFAFSRIDKGGLLALMPLAALAQVVSGVLCGLYTGRFRFGSFDEVAALARATIVTTSLVAVLNVVVTNPRMIPASAALGGGVAAFVLMGTIRYVWRLSLEAQR